MGSELFGKEFTIFLSLFPITCLEPAGNLFGRVTALFRKQLGLSDINKDSAMI